MSIKNIIKALFLMGLTFIILIMTAHSAKAIDASIVPDFEKGAIVVGTGCIGAGIFGVLGAQKGIAIGMAYGLAGKITGGMMGALLGGTIGGIIVGALALELYVKIQKLQNKKRAY
jgi:hypothetical protein